MLRFPTLALILVLYAGPVGAQKKELPKVTIPDTIELTRDVEFGIGGDRPLKMHLMKLKENPPAPRPVLVWIHGGGWRKGHRDTGIGRLLPFVEKGYFCASVEYRLSDEAKFPAQIEDCKCAIRFLRANAKKYNLDPEKIGVWGSSAGGHLVALLGTSGHVKELEGKGGWANQSSRVQAVCDFCGPSDFIKIMGKSQNAEGAVAQLLGGLPRDKQDLAALGSPVTHVRKDAPPFLIVHGDKDATVPIEQAHLLHEALKKAGVPVTLYVAEGQGHGLGGPEVMRAVEEFFERTLRKK